MMGRKEYRNHIREQWYKAPRVVRTTLNEEENAKQEAWLQANTHFCERLKAHIKMASCDTMMTTESWLCRNCPKVAGRKDRKAPTPKVCEVVLASVEWQDFVIITQGKVSLSDIKKSTGVSIVSINNAFFNLHTHGIVSFHMGVILKKYNIRYSAGSLVEL